MIDEKKLIELLEKEKERLRKLRNNTVTLTDHEVCAIEEGAFNFCKKTINELAEEYELDTTFQYVLLQTEILKRMGIDVGCKWETATQQAYALNKAYIRGRQDEGDKFSEWLEEHNNDFCEWDNQDGFYLHKTSCGTEDTYDDAYKFCPYCGKKIKVVE